MVGATSLAWLSPRAASPVSGGLGTWVGVHALCTPSTPSRPRSSPPIARTCCLDVFAPELLYLPIVRRRLPPPLYMVVALHQRGLADKAPALRKAGFVTFRSLLDADPVHLAPFGISHAELGEQESSSSLALC